MSFAPSFSVCVLALLITSDNSIEGSSGGKEVEKLGDGVWAVFQDSEKNYWFGGDGEGVYRFDGKKLTLFSREDGLSNHRVQEVKEDKNGVIYVSSDGGIYRFEDGRFVALKVNETDNVWRLHPDDLWFKGPYNASGPYRFDGETVYKLKFPKHYLEEKIRKGVNASLSLYDPYTIYKDTGGNVWFGTAFLGAARYDGKTISWIYERHLTEMENGGAFGIRSIGQDKSGKFWICSNENRFLVREGVKSGGDRVVDYDKVRGVGHGKGGEKPMFFENMVRDDKGNLWMSSNGSGVWRFDGEEMEHFEVDSGDSWLITLYADREGGIWVGTSEAGVFRFDGEGFRRFGVG